MTSASRDTADPIHYVERRRGGSSRHLGRVHAMDLNGRGHEVTQGRGAGKVTKVVHARMEVAREGEHAVVMNLAMHFVRDGERPSIAAEAAVRRQPLGAHVFHVLQLGARFQIEVESFESSGERIVDDHVIPRLGRLHQQIDQNEVSRLRAFVQFSTARQPASAPISFARPSIRGSAVASSTAPR
jgi:hypothetical protein